MIYACASKVKNNIQEKLNLLKISQETTRHSLLGTNFLHWCTNETCQLRSW